MLTHTACGDTLNEICSNSAGFNGTAGKPNALALVDMLGKNTHG